MGGWFREVEENEALRMRCCGLGMGGWVGEWVGTDLSSLEVCVGRSPHSFLWVACQLAKNGARDLGRAWWVGGWVGWVEEDEAI